jgi:hypothetical protein
MPLQEQEDVNRCASAEEEKKKKRGHSDILLIQAGFVCSLDAN